jgi:hypothetical protein
MVPQSMWYSFPGGKEQDKVGFHHNTQNDMHYKMYKLFISENFHLIFSDGSFFCLFVFLPHISETTEKSTGKRGYCSGHMDCLCCECSLMLKVNDQEGEIQMMKLYYLKNYQT